MTGIVLPDTPETRQALKTAHYLAMTRYDQLANCRTCDPKVRELYKGTAEFYHAVIIGLEEKV